MAGATLRIRIGAFYTALATVVLPFSPVGTGAVPNPPPPRSLNPAQPTANPVPGAAALNAPALSAPTSLPASSRLCALGQEGLPLVDEATAPLSQWASSLNWMDEPGAGMAMLLGQLAPTIASYMSPVTAPEIHPRARNARVPVMMYHDVLPTKQVFFDLTPEEFEQHLQLIQSKGLTPISLDQLVTHLRSGTPLPERPILLSFDDGYKGHYEHVYALLKKYGYPAVFSIYTSKVGKQMGRSSLDWEQIREMAADPLITIASHSVSHKVMTGLKDEEVKYEVEESKKILEAQLGLPIRYFTYPEGKYDERTPAAVAAAGYTAALTMDDTNEQLAGQSTNLLAIGRIGQSRLSQMVELAWGGDPMPSWKFGFDFNAPIRRTDVKVDEVLFSLISGGQPISLHAPKRGQVAEILQGSPAIAGVDGGFFSLESLDSNKMIGPVYSQSHGQFIPGNEGENKKLRGRPLVAIGPTAVRFIPFDPEKHNSLEGVRAEMPDVTDAFVGAAFLVENGQGQPGERFGTLFQFNEPRDRAFWGINQAGQPQIGVSRDPIGSVALGAALAKAGFRDAVMLDSGASTSLAYRGDSLMDYIPRPVPHVVGLVPTAADTGCDQVLR